MTERPVEQKENPKSTERQPWTPKGIWGHKDPAEMTLAEKEAMLEKAKYSGPLATAYWENEIAGHQEQPAREEAESKRSRVTELEKEFKALKEKAIETKTETKLEDADIEEVDVNEELAQGAQEELKEKKKGMGEKFKDGVRGVYNFFKKKLTRGEKTEQPEEKEEKNPEKQEMSQEERNQRPQEALQARSKTCFFARLFV